LRERRRCSAGLGGNSQSKRSMPTRSDWSQSRRRNGKVNSIDLESFAKECHSFARIRRPRRRLTRVVAPFDRQKNHVAWRDHGHRGRTQTHELVELIPAGPVPQPAAIRPAGQHSDGVKQFSTRRFARSHPTVAIDVYQKALLTVRQKWDSTRHNAPAKLPAHRRTR